MKKHKRIALKIFIIIFSFLFLNSSMVKAGDGTKELNVDGLKVIIKSTIKDVVSVRLFVRGGTANYPLEKQGIEALTYALAIKGGTVSMNKGDFLSMAERLGTTFGSEASLDYGEMHMTCLKSAWDKSWNLFSDAVMNPAFSPTEFTNKREQFISAARQNEGDPDNQLETLALTTAFKGSDYEKNPSGTSESLSGLTIDDLKSYYTQTVCKERAFLVIVGNISEADVIEKVKATLSNLPQGTPVKIMPPVKIDEAGQDIVNRNIATNYLVGIMSSAEWNSPDIAAMMVAMSIMYDKYFVELRTKRSLSYAPAAYLNTTAISSPFSELYITTDHPKEALQVMVDLINDVRKNGFNEEELKNNKNTYITRSLMRLESSAMQSLNIGRWQLKGNLKMFDDFDKQINAVSLQDINRVFTTHTGSLKWTYLGDPTKVAVEDFKQVEKVVP